MHFFNLLETTDLNKNTHQSYLLKFSRLLRPFIVENYNKLLYFLQNSPLKMSHISIIFRLKCLHLLSLNKINIINIYLSK